MDNNLYKNTAFWSWNYDMEENEVIYQLKDFIDKGYGGVFIHARSGLTIEYMGEKWFKAMDSCVVAAQQYGIDIWLYDEFGWPSGFGGGKVTALGEKYYIKQLKAYNVKIDKENHRFIACYKKSSIGDYVLSNDIDDANLYIYYTFDKHYIDVLNAECVNEFLKSTHEVYYKRYRKYFGNVIKGIFTDEPQMSVKYHWSNTLPEFFKQSRGYSLIENLWKLFADKHYTEFFYDYNLTLAEMFQQNYTSQIAAWCLDKGIKLTGHFAVEDGHVFQFRLTGGVMRNYAKMQMPGIDYLGRRMVSPVLVKQLGSIKNQLGLESVLSETFGCTGWNISFMQLSWIWGAQAAAGINKACLHLCAYTIKGDRKRDYPAFFSYQQPCWSHFKYLNKHMESISEFVSRGKPICDILVISPLGSAYALPYDSIEIRRISASFRSLLENLNELQLNYDIGDEFVMEEYAYINNGEFFVGDMKYKIIICPPVVSLRGKTVRLLNSFIKIGGIVLFADAIKPYLIDGKNKPQMLNLTNNNERDIVNARLILSKVFNYIGYTRYVTFIDIFDKTVIKDVLINIREDENNIYIFIQNISTSATHRGYLHIQDLGKLYSVNDDNILELMYSTKAENSVYSEIQLFPMQNKRYILKRGEHQSGTKYKLSSKYKVIFSSFEIDDLNCYTIDMAQFCLEGKKWTKRMPIVLLQEKMFHAVNKERRQHHVNVKYSFFVKNIPEQIMLCMETDDCNKVIFNEVDITSRFSGWWIDKSIKKADVSDIVKKGNNIVIAVYNVKPINTDIDLNKVFETEKNKFNYNVEPESIYLVGNFDVVSKNGYIKNTNYISTEGNFIIDEISSKDFNKDLTCQNMFFYRGSITGRFIIERKEHQRIKIDVSQTKGIALIISADNGEICRMNTFEPIDITDILNTGYNNVCIKLFSSNRNVFGPHHHLAKEPAFVGKNTFKGVKGFEDEILYSYLPKKIYTPEYNFVPFKIGEIFITTEEI